MHFRYFAFLTILGTTYSQPVEKRQVKIGMVPIFDGRHSKYHSADFFKKNPIQHIIIQFRKTFRLRVISLDRVTKEPITFTFTTAPPSVSPTAFPVQIEVNSVPESTWVYYLHLRITVPAERQNSANAQSNRPQGVACADQLPRVQRKMAVHTTPDDETLPDVLDADVQPGTILCE